MSYTRQQLEDLARQKAREQGIREDVFLRLVGAESSWNPQAKSSAGAQGLVQLMPATAKGLGVSNPFDPVQSLTGGSKYLKQQLDRFGGDYTKALAAYNAGPGNVEKYGGVPPFQETQNYVNKVLGGINLKATPQQEKPNQTPASSSAFNIDPQKLLAAFAGELLTSSPSLSSNIFGLLGELPPVTQNVFDAGRLTPQSSYLTQLTRPLTGL